jgi:YHS domain-containing protein
MMRVILFRFAIILIPTIALIIVVNPQIVGQEEAKRLLTKTNLMPMPFAFIENHGQFSGKALFKANFGGATFYFCRNEVAYLFVKDSKELLQDDNRFRPEYRGISENINELLSAKEAIHIIARFLDSNHDPEVVGIDRVSHVSNYFSGKDRTQWLTGVPGYSAIVYNDIYPGVDLKYYGDGRSLKCDFIVQPGADVSQIRIQYEGVEDLEITPTGDLEIQTQFGLIHEKAPYIYQEIGGKRREIRGRYYLDESDILGFVIIDDVDPRYPLVIDPELVYSTYLGGDDDDDPAGIAVDQQGNIYIAGSTESNDFPAANAYDSSYNGEYDIFVTNLSAAGDSLIYSTYIGGSRDDVCFDLALDTLGNIYIIGQTQSIDFPMVNPIDGNLDGSADVFIAKLSSVGDSLFYSTYLGGSSSDRGYSIDVDESGIAFITGDSHSADFPTVNPYDGSLDGVTDIFISKISEEGDSLLYSTFLGGNGNDYGIGIVLDNLGNIYIGGHTTSNDFPVVNPFDSTLNGTYDVIVAKLSTAGDSLVYSTYLGGDLSDYCHGGIDVDDFRNAYVAGSTWHSDFPTVNPYDGSYNGNGDVFVTKLSTTGNSLAYSTYLGGRSQDRPTGITVDRYGNAYIIGTTGSYDFPMMNPYDNSYNGDFDAFVAKLLSGGDSLAFSTFLGGSDNDGAGGIAVDSSGNAYVIGGTHSYDFPTKNAYDPSFNGGPHSDLYIAKFGFEICDFITGDINGNNHFDGLDIIYGVTFMKGGNDPLCNYCSSCPFWHYCGDINGSCSYNGLDITYGVSYFKSAQSELIPCPDCPQMN